MPTYSRRSVLFGFGAAVGLASLPRHAFAALDGTPFTFLTDSEARSLALLCDTLIPQDDFPSASQAGVVDFIDLIVHLFEPGRRQYYDLENLWADAPEIDFKRPSATG